MNDEKLMTYEDITLAEANRLYPTVLRIYRFYARLLERMQQRGFASSGRYYICVNDALDRSHTVMTKTFYATVKSGVGYPERKE